MTTGRFGSRFVSSARLFAAGAALLLATLVLVSVLAASDRMKTVLLLAPLGTLSVSLGTFFLALTSLKGSVDDVQAVIAKHRPALLLQAREELHLARSQWSKEFIPVPYQLTPGLTAQELPIGVQQRNVGRASRLANLYTEEQITRMFLIGDAGAGKTTALREMQRQFSLGQVPWFPVAVNLAAWDGDLTLDVWLKAQLAAYVPSQYIDQLYRQANLILLLDGLDETDRDGEPLTRATAVLAGLQQVAARFVVTCRRTQFELLRTSSDEDTRMPDSVSIELLPVNQPDMIQYLQDCCVRFQPADVPDLFHEEPSALETTLSSPLFLRLAADLLNEPNPDLVTQAARLESTEKNVAILQTALFEELFRAACRRPKLSRRPWKRSGLTSTTDVPRPPASAASYYKEDDVKAWSQTLARFLRDFALEPISGALVPRGLIVPHQLWPSVGFKEASRAGLALTVVLWFPLLATLLALLVQGKLDTLQASVLLPLAALALFLSFMLFAERFRPLKISPRRLVDKDRLERVRAWTRVGVGAVASTALFVLAAIATQYGFGFAYALGFVVPFGLGFAVAVRPDAILSEVFVAGLLASALLEAPAFFLVNHYQSVRLNLAAGLVAGFVALVVGVAVTVKSQARAAQPSLPRNFVAGDTPYFRLLGDLQTGIFIGAISSAIVFAAVWRTPFINVSDGTAILLSLSAGLAAGPGTISVAWRRYMGMLIAARGRLPVALRNFFEWGYLAGIFRRSTAAYQFRHERLEEYFVNLSLETEKSSGPSN